MFGKFVTKLIQSLPTWEVTKYYGRVCMYQLKCLKYKFQTSEAWFNFKCKFMPGSLRNEIECECENKVKQEQCKDQSKVKKVSPGSCQYGMKGKKESFEDLIDVKSKRTENDYCQNEKYTMHEDYPKKKKRKAKHAQ